MSIISMVQLKTGFCTCSTHINDLECEMSCEMSVKCRVKCRGFKSHLRQLFFFRKGTASGGCVVLLCFVFV